MVLQQAALPPVLHVGRVLAGIHISRIGPPRTCPNELESLLVAAHPEQVVDGVPVSVLVSPAFEILVPGVALLIRPLFDDGRGSPPVYTVPSTSLYHSIRPQA